MPVGQHGKHENAATSAARQPGVCRCLNASVFGLSGRLRQHLRHFNPDEDCRIDVIGLVEHQTIKTGETAHRDRRAFS